MNDSSMSNSKLSERLEHVERFFEACAKGRLDVLRGFLVNDPSLVRVSNPKAHHRARQFWIREPNGHELYFIQEIPIDRKPD